MGRIGLAFLLGHCLVHSLERLPAMPPAAAALLAALALATSRWSRLVAVLLLGIAWAWCNSAARLALDLPTALEGKDLLVGGQIASLPQVSAGDAQFLFDVDSAPSGVPSRLRLDVVPHGAVARRGRCMAADGAARNAAMVSPTSAASTTKATCSASRSAQSAMCATTSAIGASQSASPCCMVLRLRELDGIACCGSGEWQPHAGNPAGTCRRRHAAVSAAQWRVFGATGTTHLMAISGLHISMVATLAAWLGGAIVRWPGAQARAWNAMHGQVDRGRDRGDQLLGTRRHVRADAAHADHAVHLLHGAQVRDAIAVRATRSAWR